MNLKPGLLCLCAFLLASCVPMEKTTDFLIVRMDYSSAMLGNSSDLTVTRQEHPFVWMPAYPPTGWPMAVVFRDEDGEVITRKLMTIVDVQDRAVMIDAPLVVRWVTWVENDPRFACVELETELDKGFHPDRAAMEGISLPLC